MREIPSHLIWPVVEKIVVLTEKQTKRQNSRSQEGRSLTVREKKEALEQQKIKLVVTRRNLKSQKNLNNFMHSIKSKLIDKKIDSDSISDQMLSITVGDAKNAIKEKRFIQLIYE